MKDSTHVTLTNINALILVTFFTGRFKTFETESFKKGINAPIFFHCHTYHCSWQHDLNKANTNNIIPIDTRSQNTSRNP